MIVDKVVKYNSIKNLDHNVILSKYVLMKLSFISTIVFRILQKKYLLQEK